MPVVQAFQHQLLNIQRRFKNKKELLKFLRHYSYVYLPSDTHVTLHFLQQVVTGRKSYLLIINVKQLNVPVCPELSVVNVWEDALRLPGVWDHFPNEWEGCRRVDRKFFWGILSSLHPAYVKELIIGSRNARKLHREQQQIPRNLLQPNPEWVDQLLAENGFVTGPGRRTGPSFLIERPIRPRMAPRQQPTFQHNVRVEDYLEAYAQNQAENQGLNIPSDSSAHLNIPAQILQPPLEVQRTEVQSVVDDLPEVMGQQLSGQASGVLLDNQSNASFRSAVGGIFGGGRPSNVPMMGQGNFRRPDDFQSASGGSGQ